MTYFSQLPCPGKVLDALFKDYHCEAITEESTLIFSTAVPLPWKMDFLHRADYIGGSLLPFSWYAWKRERDCI